MLIVVAIIAFCGYFESRNVNMRQLTNLQLANIEALADEENTPIKIPCSDCKEAECKILTVGSDGIWRHIKIIDMQKTN